MKTSSTFWESDHREATYARHHLLENHHIPPTTTIMDIVSDASIADVEARLNAFKQELALKEDIVRQEQRAQAALIDLEQRHKTLGESLVDRGDLNLPSPPPVSIPYQPSFRDTGIGSTRETIAYLEAKTKQWYAEQERLAKRTPAEIYYGHPAHVVAAAIMEVDDAYMGLMKKRRMEKMEKAAEEHKVWVAAKRKEEAEEAAPPSAPL
jgi:hypothetical protein